MKGAASDMTAGRPVARKHLDLIIALAADAVGGEQMFPWEPGFDNLYLDEGRYHIKKAGESLAAKDWKAAAAELRRSISYLKAKADRVGEEAKQALGTSVQDLERVADKLERGVESDRKEVEQTYYRAIVALYKRSSIHKGGPKPGGLR